MKYILLFILLAPLCRAQENYGNFTKVTAYRLVNEYNDGPCNINEYIKKEQRIGYYIQAAQSYDSKMAYTLLQLKKQATSYWPEEIHDCDGRLISAETIPNMYVVEVNRYKDTIYTTKDNCGFFMPEGKVYFDNESRITTALTDEFINFFDRDFSTEIKEHKPDSIPVKQVMINGIQVSNHSRKSFEKSIARFQLSRTDSVFSRITEIHKEYWLNNLQVKFDKPSGKINELNVRYTTGTFKTPFILTLGGLKIGDSVEKVIELYPASTKFRNWGAHTSAPDSSCYYEIQFTEGKGFAYIYIRDNAIREMEITFF